MAMVMGNFGSYVWTSEKFWQGIDDFFFLWDIDFFGEDFGME